MKYEYELYKAETPEEIKNRLNNYGVAIVPSVLDSEECNMLYNGLWNDIEYITQDFDIPIKQNDSSTWREWSKLYPKHSMLLQNYQIGHTQSVWDVRQNSKVVNVFSDIWNSKPDDMLCSFDGISMHMPPEKTRKGWFRNNWLHTDQSYTRPNFECIQGWVTAKEIREKDGTLTFLKNSHKYHSEVADKFNIQDKQDWYKIDDDMYNYYTEDLGCEQECVKCPAGSLVLWDSRTIHCGREPMKDRTIENTRCIVYVCMVPRNKATQASIKKKQKAFNDLRMTTHYPHKPKLFPINPRTYGGPLPKVRPIKPPHLTNLGKKLAGFTTNTDHLISLNINICKS